jgi:hypothetical protein
MIRGKRTDFILKQFKRKSKKILKRDLFTEFFYLNKERNIIEFLETNQITNVNTFFKEFLSDDLKPFVNVKIYNDCEEEIKTWYYKDENLLLVIDVKWGFKTQEISTEICIDNFLITIIDDKKRVLKSIDYNLLNDFVISFLTLKAKEISEIYKKLN